MSLLQRSYYRLVHASRCATQPGESRVLLAHVVAAIGKVLSFLRYSDILAIVIGGSILIHRRHYEDVDRRCEYSSYGIRAQVVPAILHPLSVMVLTKVTKVTRFLRGARLKADVDVSPVDEDCQCAVPVFPARAHREES